MIYTIGETVLDVIVQSFDDVVIKVGGSMLNTAVSLGRLGQDVHHISYVSNDQVADEVLRFLMGNHVGTNYLLKSDNLKTNLALAFLDHDKNASYTFYKNTNLEDVHFVFPEIADGDIVLFGSFFSLMDCFRAQLVDFLEYAKKRGAFIIYDPNFRKPHLKELNKTFPFIEENLKLAHLVKGSNEDFQLIFNLYAGTDVWEKLKTFSVEHLVYTEGAKGASFFNSDVAIFQESDNIVPVSTIGAGDTFTSGIIYYLRHQNIDLCNEANVRFLLKESHAFSAEVCQSFENYLSVEFAKNYINVQ